MVLKISVEFRLHMTGGPAFWHGLGWPRRSENILMLTLALYPVFLALNVHPPTSLALGSPDMS